jgi:hypothetical protein
VPSQSGALLGAFDAIHTHTVTSSDLLSIIIITTDVAAETALPLPLADEPKAWQNAPWLLPSWPLLLAKTCALRCA